MGVNFLLFGPYLLIYVPQGPCHGGSKYIAVFAKRFPADADATNFIFCLMAEIRVNKHSRYMLIDTKISRSSRLQRRVGGGRDYRIYSVGKKTNVLNSA